MSEITIAHRDRIEEIRARYGHALSAHAFPSLYLWREAMDLRLFLEENLFSVRCAGYGENAWFFPCGGEEAKSAFLERRMAKPDLILLYLRGEDAAWLEDRCPGRFALRRRYDADEYLYDRAVHVNLEGGRFHHIRRRLHKIRRDLFPRTAPLGDDTAEDVLQVAALWAEQNPGVGRDDRTLVAEALIHRRELGLQGVVVYLSDHPAAFMMGFPLTEDTFDANVGKCAAGVQGLTYYTLRELFAALPPHFRWCNLEEDLGLPGLRDMKEHFLPERKHEIWEARCL